MSNYFSRIPDFEYVSLLPDAKISDYIQVKNLFKKGFIREDIFQDTTFFTKYTINGDDRPDNVAFKVYGDSTFDWIVLQSNNIINIQTEWPLSQNDFDRYALDKYGDYNTLFNGVHHYETLEVKNSNGVVILESGKQVPQDFSITYFDIKLGQYITASNATVAVTNYEYENIIQENKRNIFLLKNNYIPVVLNDMENIMPYRKGSTQFVSETLKRADNIRLYD
jgi:nicotinamide riboside kinase|tara:strand:+ start:200 stop:868 length:669 start_codon:yes stop_codon:yes gene_type:complete